MCEKVILCFKLMGESLYVTLYFMVTFVILSRSKASPGPASAQTWTLRWYQTNEIPTQNTVFSGKTLDRNSENVPS